jgi:hypothetical protein
MGRLHRFHSIDQKNSKDDWVWNAVPSANKDTGTRPRADMTYDDEDPAGKSVFDANDVIVFLARDVGDRNRAEVAQLGAQKIVELEVTDPVDATRGWTYIAYFESDAPSRSDTRYVRYEASELRVIGPDHEFRYSPQDIMVLDDFRVGGVSIFAGNRIRGKVKAGLGPLTIDVEFSEKSIEGYNLGYIEGPVRIIRRSVEHVRTKSGIESPEVNCDHFHYPWHAEIPLLLSIRFPVEQVSLIATSAFRGSHFSTAEVEGAANPIALGNHYGEENLATEYPDAKWVGLGGEHVFVINMLRLPEKHYGHLEVSPYLTHNKFSVGRSGDSTGPEVEAGFSIRTTADTAWGEYVLHAVYLFAATPLEAAYRTQAIRLLEHKLNVKVSTLTD